LHDKKIIHRDLKPENLIFKDKDHYDIRIVDFGLSEFIDDPEQLYKRSGTPGYVAPEILKGKPHNEKSDIFALGVILYLL
jgi:serine/threonine protein kinase